MKLGCQTHFNNNSYPLTALGSGYTIPQLLQQLGVDFVRDECAWGEESTQGAYSFPPQFSYFAALAALGIEILFTADFANKFYDGGKTPYSPPGLAGFTEYVLAVLRQFPQLQFGPLEVYNEPDSSTFANGPFYFAPARSYASMVREVSSAVKALYPQTHIIGGATSTQCVPFLRECAAWGIAAHIDGWSFHYQEDEILEQFAPWVHSLIGKPISLTEYGAGGALADLIVRTSVLAYASGAVEYLSWYQSFGDSSAWIAADGTITALGAAFRQVANLIHSGSGSRVNNGDPSCYHWRFPAGDVFWGRYGQAVSITNGTCYDSAGNQIPAPGALTFSPIVCVGGAVTITPRSHIDNSRIGWNGPNWSYYSNTSPPMPLQAMQYGGALFGEVYGDPVHTPYLQVRLPNQFEPYAVGVFPRFTVPQACAQIVIRGYLSPNASSNGFTLTIAHNGSAISTDTIPPDGGEFDFTHTVNAVAALDTIDFVIDCRDGVYTDGNCAFEVELSNE